MELLLVGCEYSGTTTLAEAIFKWGSQEMGADFGLFHDHWKLPLVAGHSPEDEASRLDDEAAAAVAALPPNVKEQIQRHSLYYHIQPWAFWSDRAEEQGFYPDYLAVGMHIEDAIYGRLYFDYGKKGMPGDRDLVGPNIERAIMEWTPNMVLVHVKASPEVIRQRMKTSPHKYQVVQDRDVERVLESFADAYAGSLFANKIELDTSSATVDETLREFAAHVEPFLTDNDRRRRTAGKA